LHDIPDSLLEFDSSTEITRDLRGSHPFTKNDSNSDLVYDPDIY
jgi:hypothetical protein